MRILILVLCFIVAPSYAQEDVADLVDSQTVEKELVRDDTEMATDVIQNEESFENESTERLGEDSTENEAAELDKTELGETQAGETTEQQLNINADIAAEEQAPVDTPAPVAQTTKSPARGSEVVNLSATIVGNQEQPTVLYIVPWKPAEDTTILYLPLSSKAMEHIFGHVERVEHQRQVQYIDQLDKQ